MDTIRLLCRCPECGKESVLEGVDIAPVRPSEMHISTGVGLICAIVSANSADRVLFAGLRIPLNRNEL